MLGSELSFELFDGFDFYLVEDEDGDVFRIFIYMVKDTEVWLGGRCILVYTDRKG